MFRDSAAITIYDLRHEACAELVAHPYFSAHAPDMRVLEVDALLMHVLGKTRAGLIASLRDLLTEDQVVLFKELFRRRLELEPLSYLTGVREFYGLEFKVSPCVLIPRPETELLVEIVLKELIARQVPTVVVDVGVGSGAIIVSVAKEVIRSKLGQVCDSWVKGSCFVGTDISPEAIAVAESNARKHAVLDVATFMPGKYFASLSRDYVRDRSLVVVSNPPYLSAVDHGLDEVSPEVKLYEPHQALFCEDEGLEVFINMVDELNRLALFPRLLAVELADRQFPRASEILGANGYKEIQWHNDLAGLRRVISARHYKTEGA